MSVREDKVVAIAANCGRLISDARLLDSYGRKESAYALAVLALEEVGKLLLQVWGFPDRRGYSHLSKQRAAAALDFAKTVVDTARADPQLTREALKRRLSESAEHNEASRFGKRVNQMAIDKAKQLALYRDGADDHDITLADLDAEAIIAKGDRVIRLIEDFAVVAAGKAVFEVWRSP